MKKVIKSAITASALAFLLASSAPSLAQAADSPAPASQTAATGGTKGPELEFSLPNDPLSRGKRLEAAGNPYEAIRVLQQALKTDNSNPDIWRALADIYFRLNKKEYAVQCYEAALKLRPDVNLRAWLEKYKFQLPADSKLPQANPDHISTTPTSLQIANDWISPLWRSALLPGWGQSYNRESTKAWLLGGSTIALAAGVLGSALWASQAEDDYMNLGAGHPPSHYDSAYSNWELSANTNHAVFIVFGLAYAYNLYDALVNAKAPITASARIPYVQVSFTAQSVRARVDLARF